MYATKLIDAIINQTNNSKSFNCVTDHTFERRTIIVLAQVERNKNCTYIFNFCCQKIVFLLTFNMCKVIYLVK